MENLTTPRLTIRALEMSDLEAFHAICGDATAMRFMGNGQPLTVEQTWRWITVSQNNYALHSRGCMAVLERGTNEMIGFCGLVVGDDAGEIELIYGFAPIYWGRGYASESASAMLEYGRTFLPRIHASIYPQNSASQRILQKLGFEQTRVATDGTICFQLEGAVSA